MTEKEKYAYMAGIIDGEGSLTIITHDSNRRTRPNFTPRIAVGMIEKEIIEMLRNEFGGALHIDKDCSRNFPFYKWTINTGRAVNLCLNKIQKYLIVKKRQAGVLRKLCDRKHLEHKGRMSDEELRIRKELKEEVNKINRLKVNY